MDRYSSSNLETRASPLKSDSLDKIERCPHRPIQQQRRCYKVEVIITNVHGVDRIHTEFENQGTHQWVIRKCQYEDGRGDDDKAEVYVQE